MYEEGGNVFFDKADRSTGVPLESMPVQQVPMMVDYLHVRLAQCATEMAASARDFDAQRYDAMRRQSQGLSRLIFELIECAPGGVGDDAERFLRSLGSDGEAA